MRSLTRDFQMSDAGDHAIGDVDVAQLVELRGSGFSLAMQMLGNHHDAADALQDALHTVLRKRRLFDRRRGELRAWFLKIVRNRCLDLLRRGARRRTEPAELTELSSPGQEQPEAVAEKREMLELLKTQLMAMEPDQREIVLLRDYHDLSYAEVADVLAIPPGTVMSRLHRARTELRRRMQTYR